ncbi:hypothetical protein DLREEDagrD3_12200 [Denitratisoma sp. agr-D3]
MLFSLLVPKLLARPEFNLEIFGAGGYASVRDLSRVLAPLGKRVRYWGHQQDVRAVYEELDYMLTGLPEKEALGLNVIEAQACGLPVLAIQAPPFNETVLPGQTGILYRDPREDNGTDFLRVLDVIAAKTNFFSSSLEIQHHLERFTADAFRNRIRTLLSDSPLSFLAAQS